MTNETDIQNCPFCGELPIGSQHNGTYEIGCNNQYCIQPRYRFKNKKEAHKVWNQRTPSDSLSGGADIRKFDRSILDHNPWPGTGFSERENMIFEDSWKAAMEYVKEHMPDVASQQEATASVWRCPIHNCVHMSDSECDGSRKAGESTAAVDEAEAVEIMNRAMQEITDSPYCPVKQSSWRGYMIYVYRAPLPHLKPSEDVQRYLMPPDEDLLNAILDGMGGTRDEYIGKGTGVLGHVKALLGKRTKNGHHGR